MSNMTKLKQQRGTIKSQLSRLNSYLDNLNVESISNLTENELELRSIKYESLWNYFNELEDIIECECKEEDIESEFGEQGAFETSYFSNISRIKDLTFDTMWKPRQIGSKTLMFEMIEEKKILRIEDMCGNEIYLGWETVSKVWSLESVLGYRLSYSSGSNCKHFYEDVIRAVAEMSGDVKVLLIMPEKALFDVQLERRIQEQEIHFIKKMWMLYAEQHWTKAIHLKSAVVRLYEKLGILEFDADHEAIYGMERYYTVQQSEELLEKYITVNDPKYNINGLKTGDCETMLLNQTIYYLNKSKSKWISVGLYYPFEFASVVKIFGRSKQYVIFKEEEWIQFHEQRENINKYFQTFDTMWKPRRIGSKTLTFEMIEEKKILKIENISGNEVYLGWESVSEVWSLESVLRYRISYSSKMSGDVKINIYNIINRLFEKSDDVCCMLEVLLFMPKKELFDVQLKKRIQEQEIQFIRNMWMLYAQERWTKAFDLKLPVERLYEELGALEFDADHEAIYGMETYYTVQQCEEL
ncbi:hypothetical protein FQA39_LY10159 [Lamprigera yunnana]|nr:hypothetical protein FQA39_LY10159 [Lamprigera yunnana]